MGVTVGQPYTPACYLPAIYVARGTGGFDHQFFFLRRTKSRRFCKKNDEHSSEHCLPRLSAAGLSLSCSSQSRAPKRKKKRRRRHRVRGAPISCCCAARQLSNVETRQSRSALLRGPRQRRTALSVPPCSKAPYARRFALVRRRTPPTPQGFWNRRRRRCRHVASTPVHEKRKVLCTSPK